MENINGSETLTISGEGMARGQKVEIKELSLNKIKLGRNSRLSTSNEDLSGLMQSINSVGLLEPIGVVKTKDGKGYEVAYGNRRFMAFSKLGLHSIPAIIHERKSDNDVDVKNLTENVQRRNISLAEIGRYATILEGEGLGIKELAVRLGTTTGYVKSCVDAWNEVPKEYKEDLEHSLMGAKVQPGKISITSARAILNAKKSFALGPVMTKELFKASKDARFVPDSVPAYVAAMKRGSKDPLSTVKQVRRLAVSMLMDQDEFDRLEEVHVVNGPFNSVTALIKAILTGKKSVRIKLIE